MIPYSALEQPNGDIVVLSQFDFVNDFGTQIGLTRYTSAGVLDSTFGTKGSVITKFSLTFEPFAFALEPNGDFLVAGSVGNASGNLGGTHSVWSAEMRGSPRKSTGSSCTARTS